MKVIALGLEHVYETPFDIQLSRVILEPLRMSDTTFALAPTQMGRLATGYGKDGKATPYHTVNAGPSWGLYSDTADMARYVRWQLDEKDPVIAQAHALIAGTPADGKGLIWNEGLDRGERMLWHGGGSFGMSSQVVLYPARQRGVVLLANDACPGTEGVLKAMGMALGAIKP
jgi:CubicO group peptidase (beta-lactamase class C family)